jgi:hypothetical protein
MNGRERLPNRRRCSTRGFTHGGMKFLVTAGFYSDGRLGEIFISGERPGSAIEALGHDAAVAASIALQFGADPQTIRHVLLKDSDNAPTTLLGSALAALAVVDLDEAPAP